MLEVEGAADRPLGGAAVSGAPSDRPGKTVTDSPPLRSAPITLASPPEFVVCPLMREIPAFRYFWPDRDISDFAALHGVEPIIRGIASSRCKCR